jgi:uncharacterized protein (UPF0335 family)
MSSVPTEQSATATSTTKGGISHGQLKSIVTRIEKLEEEKATIAADIKEVYAEAKANGFDTKILRKIVALRRKAAAERAEEEALLDTYMAALGMLPLFEDDADDELIATKGKSED